MNKKLSLLAILGFLNFNSLSAQMQTISFESSEGFTLGNVNGQNGWTVTGAGAGVFIANQEISAAKANHGTQSLKIAEDLTYAPQQQLIMGAYYNFPTALNSTHYSVSADINFDYVSGTDESAFLFALGGSTNFLAQFIFDYTGDMLVTTLDNTGVETAEQVAGKTWAGNQWYNIKIEIDGTQMKYYLNNNLEFTGTITANEQFKHLRFVHDNWGGSGYLDNIVVTDLTTSSNKSFEINDFSFYPNPSTDVLNVTLVDKNIQSVHVTDLNGRTVKTFNISGTNQAQLDVSGLSSGVYLLNVKSDGITVAKKFIKK
ncbi:T9SS type A sorting domain-containing protein [Flavobacterium sp. xlx-214]|uniref:T9SS type A sorting domain-containing protein n=1 Tax=unclassified Flavobacterium TaxID=196869 RepID=UPI0013CF4724|nr:MULTISPECIES: T9SS type A sorting domain-containing protein [unclassified Flavobacterium]MBA5792321.1 T9SS type A sorting domain-containing protein [Flavobacterium sp. xlx-221]QMI82363.1 T9SS type A sorting domain-containing protein [Flavobacterium sp. xlx-214]